MTRNLLLIGIIIGIVVVGTIGITAFYYASDDSSNLNPIQETLEFEDTKETDLRLILSITSPQYVLGEKIGIIGKVLDQNNQPIENYLHDVTIKVDNGQLLEVAQLKIDEFGKFSHQIKPNADLWKTGTYTVSALYDKKIAQSNFDFINPYYLESAKWNVNVIQWLEPRYSTSDTGVVRVISPDMNLNPKEVDNFDVDVWSDTDFAGIDLTVTETGDTTGIFEGTVFFTITDDTSGHRLRVSHGDTIYSKFDGYTLHESLDVDKNDLISTASINGVGIPIDDRVSLDKKSYAWNDKVIIIINAPEENFDVNSIEIIDSFKDSIKIYTRHFGIDNYNLVETEINSGIFSGEIILADEFNNFDSDGITVSFEYVRDVTAIGSAPIILNPEPESIIDDRCGVDTVSIDGVCQVIKVETIGDDAPFFGIFVYLDDLFSWIMENFGNEQAETVDMSSKELKSSGNVMSFSDFADNFSTCSSATFKHTMITDDGYPIYVIANITDDCKIHVTHDNREDKNTDVAHRKLIEAECDKLKLEDDFIDFRNCIISENESADIRVWK